MIWYCVENNTVPSTMEFGTKYGFSFQMGSLMRANDGSNDLNMHWYEYGMYGMQQYVVVSTNSNESLKV